MEHWTGCFYVAEYHETILFLIEARLSGNEMTSEKARGTSRRILRDEIRGRAILQSEPGGMTDRRSNRQALVLRSRKGVLRPDCGNQELSFRISFQYRRNADRSRNRRNERGSFGSNGMR
jgi:hypothetical protein